MKKVKEAIQRKKINNLNFLINLLDKGFFPCYKLKSFNAKEVGDQHIMSFLFVKTLLKPKKEERMKKLVIIALAVFLAMPVLSHAAAVNNRWDMTIGGFIQFHGGYADQLVGSSFNKNTPNRDNGSREVMEQTSGNIFAEGASRLNFIVKGPDAWGAKTMARLEFDFTTVPAGESIGLANFRHSYMQFNWANDEILIGNTWYIGLHKAPGGGLTFQSLPNIIVPSRAPQIRYTHNFGKSGFSVATGVEYPGLGKWMATNNNYYDKYTDSGYPNVVLNVDYTSDACGRIGPDRLKFGASGTYGQEKNIRSTSGTARGTMYSGKQNDGYIINAYGYVPIIPEKNMNKAGALGVQGGMLWGQGLANYSASGMLKGTYPTSRYASQTSVNQTFTEDFSSPLAYGWYGALSVYAHNQLHFDFLYTDAHAQTSNFYNSYIAGQTGLARATLYNVAMMYEPNPAITAGRGIYQTVREICPDRLYAVESWVHQRKMEHSTPYGMFAGYSF